MPVITLGKRKQFLFPTSEPQLSHAWQVRAEMALTITTEITPALDICLRTQVLMPTNIPQRARQHALKLPQVIYRLEIFHIPELFYEASVPLGLV